MMSNGSFAKPLDAPSTSTGSLDRAFWNPSTTEPCAWRCLHGLRFATEYRIEVTFRGHRVGFQRLDLVVGNVLAVELKSVERLDFVHKAQLLSYLRVAKPPAGLLFNFNATPLIIRRVVL